MFLSQQNIVDLSAKGWDCYSSGGGCYHAMKEFKTLKGNLVAVETHWSGGCQMYQANGETRLVGEEELVEDNCFPNYIELAWLIENFDEKNNFIPNYTEYETTDFLSVFPTEAQLEIIETMIAFTKAYDEYFA